MSNKSRYAGNLLFRGKIKKPDLRFRKFNPYSKKGRFSTRTLQSLRRPIELRPKKKESKHEN